MTEKKIETHFAPPPPPPSVHASCPHHPRTRPAATNASLTPAPENPDGWKIIDVYMDGTVSELSLRRAEFSSVAKREGFNSLIQTLEAKIEKLAAEG